MPDLEICPTCDARFDPASLDETLFHAFASCTDPAATRPQTGLRGVLAEEPPQG